MNTPIVYIVDDDSAVRDSVSILCETAGLTVEAYDSGEAFLEGFRPEQAGCLVLDVRMDGMSGQQLHAELKRRGSRLPVIYLTGHGDIPMGVRAMKDGAVDFLTKPVDSDELLDRVQVAVAREYDRLDQREKSALRCQWLANITPREMEILKLMLVGEANKEIARRLGISHRTVEFHRSNVFHKTGTDNLLELAQLAADCDISQAN